MLGNFKKVALFSTVSLTTIFGLIGAAPSAFADSNVSSSQSVSQGQTFYVSPNGSDQNSGTSPQQAWKTISRVNSQALVAGDSVLFQGGQSFSGNLYLSPTEQGSTSAPITIGSYGTGHATILAGTGAGIYAYDTAGITIQHLDITGSGPDTNTDNGISFYNDLSGATILNNIQIIDDNITGFHKGGITIGAYNATANNGYNNIVINGVHAWSDGDHGISLWGNFVGFQNTVTNSNVTIENCVANDNLGLSSATGNTGSGIVLGQTGNGVIENCQSYDNGLDDTYPSGGPAGIWAWDSNDITIKDNVSHDNHTSCGADGDGFDFDGGVTNSIMENNISYNNDGAGYLLCQFYYAGPWGNNIVRDNISTNDGRKNNYSSLQVYPSWGEDMNTAQVYDNTFVMSPNAGESPSVVWLNPNGGTVENFNIHNNNFVSNQGVPLVTTVNNSNPPYQATGFTFSNNSYQTVQGPFVINWNGTVYNSLQAWTSATGQN